jgi:hypothetical protein
MESQPQRRRRPEQGSPVGEALVWASRVMAIGITMFLPGVVGGWLDDRFGLGWLGPAGLVLGFAAALAALVQLASKPVK